MNFKERNEAFEMDLFKEEYSLDKIKLSNKLNNELVDKSLLKFSFKIKQIVDEYGKFGYSTLSSFLYTTIEDFLEFQEEWRKEREENLKS